MAEKLFSKEAVEAAIHFVARSMSGLVGREEARKNIESLPEGLAEIVMKEVINASREATQRKAQTMARVFGLLASELSTHLGKNQ